jgi:RNA recognition motif-containing protein
MRGKIFATKQIYVLCKIIAYLGNLELFFSFSFSFLRDYFKKVLKFADIINRVRKSTGVR